MTTHSKVLLAAAIAALALAAGGSANAAAKTIQLPPDPVQLKASALPGYAKAQANCVACHSAEYMLYQPPNAPRPYWDAMVKRMKAVFKAPIDDADMPAIVDYLAKTYGNEQPK
ncbi:cytochrome c [Caenimonas terrae]|uniref:Cytochrome c n=1 Tax=Caenimonas terrae TaxID=696074 RepID=A0ABW0NGN5_9BURK